MLNYWGFMVKKRFQVLMLLGMLVGTPVLAGCYSQPAPPVESGAQSNPSPTPEPAPEPRPEPAPSGQAISCSDAFRAAASVPLSRTNDAEVRVTMFSCSDVDEWWQNAKAFPNAFGATSYADSELGLYVRVACFDAENSPVCQDASRRGLL